MSLCILTTTFLFTFAGTINQNTTAYGNSTTARYINVNGSLFDLSSPCVMGILNVTPDSFYAGSRMQTEADIARRVEQIVVGGSGYY